MLGSVLDGLSVTTSAVSQEVDGFTCFSLQFADAEAYFAPCTTDTSANNCLVRSLICWRSFLCFWEKRLSF